MIPMSLPRCSVVVAQCHPLTVCRHLLQGVVAAAEKQEQAKASEAAAPEEPGGKKKGKKGKKKKFEGKAYGDLPPHHPAAIQVCARCQPHRSMCTLHEGPAGEAWRCNCATMWLCN